MLKLSASLGNGHKPFGRPNPAVRAAPRCLLSQASVGLQTRLHSSTRNCKKTKNEVSLLEITDEKTNREEAEKFIERQEIYDPTEKVYQNSILKFSH